MTETNKTERLQFIAEKLNTISVELLYLKEDIEKELKHQEDTEK